MLKLIAAILTVAALLIPGAPPAAQETAVSQPRQAQLTAQEVEQIALSHAELTTASVTGLRSKYDGDERIPHWDVEFRYGDYEYDYEIDPQTGAVLKWEKDYEGRQTSAQPAQSTKPTTQEEAKTITRDEAKAIALKHAGLSAGQVSRLKAEYDVDDGVPEYDVEFRVGNLEYEYEIHAKTGKILSWDKDYDD